jgi:hypothetical protein
MLGDQQKLWLGNFQINGHASMQQPPIQILYEHPSLQYHASSGSSYQQHVPLLQQNYPDEMGLGGMPQPPPEIMEEEDFQQQVPGMEAAYIAYQTALKEIFQNIINGRLADASLSLLKVSEWLLGHVVDLGKFAFLLFDLAY